MGSYIIYFIQSILGVGAGSYNTSALTHSVTTYSTSAYSFVTHIGAVAIKPVSATIISIMFVLELARNASHIEGDREMGVKIIAATMFKCTLLLVAASHADLILKAMNEAVAKMTKALSSPLHHATALSSPLHHATALSSPLHHATALSSPLHHATALKIPQATKDAINNASYADQAGALLLTLIPYLATCFISLVVAGLIFMRFAEIYILTAFVTLPIAFMAHPDTKSIGIGYLKRYATALLYGVVLLMVIDIYPRLMLGTVKKLSIPPADDVSGWICNNFHTFLIGPIVLGILLFAAGRITKAILGD